MIKNIASFIKIKPALVIGFLFATSSLLFGIWVASIPGVKYRLGFTDGSLGLSLLLSPLGAITGVLVSPKLFSKISVGRWMFNSYIVLCTVVVLQINAMNRPLFWLSLYLFGLLSFLNGVAINATVNIMEKKYNRLMMSTCHGMYSLGGAISAGLAVVLFSLHIISGIQIMIVASVIIIIILFSKNLLLGNRDIIHSGSGLKLPSLPILGLSFICMVSFMSEGCVADWSAIYFKEVLHSPKALVSLGYAGFSVAMTIGRLNGDALLSKIGSKKIVIAGSLVACTGFITVVLSPVVPIAIAGYILIGFGCCCIVPVLFRASGNIPGVSSVEGFAMITTGGLIGFLTGPSLIGFIAEKAGLSKALSLLILMTLLAAFVAWRNKFLVNEKTIEPTSPYDEQIY
jgi:hypothetical protein